MTSPLTVVIPLPKLSPVSDGPIGPKLMPPTVMSCGIFAVPSNCRVFIANTPPTAANEPIEIEVMLSPVMLKPPKMFVILSRMMICRELSALMETSFDNTEQEDRASISAWTVILTVLSQIPAGNYRISFCFEESRFYDPDRTRRRNLM